MIKVNLLGDDTVIDHSGTIIAILYSLSVLAVGICCFLLFSVTSSRIGQISAETDELKVKLAKLKEITKEVRLLEDKKKELANKLSIMSQLKQAKSGPVRMLSDLNDSVPMRSWLTRMEEKGKQLQLTGISLDDETTAFFMQQLERSNHIGKVQLEETSQIDQKGVKVKQFTLKAGVNYAGEGGSKKGVEQSSSGSASVK